VGVAAALLAAGAVLPPPPLSARQLPAWIEARGPAAAVAAGLRGLALVAVGALLALTVVGLSARLALPLRRLTARLPVWMGRRVAERALGVGVVAGIGLALTPTSALAAPPPAGSEVSPTTQPGEPPGERALMIPLREGSAPPTTVPPTTTIASPALAPDLDPPSERRDDTVTMTEIGDDPSGASTPSTSTPPPTPTVPPTESASPADPDGPAGREATDPARPVETTTGPSDASSWRVELGDHLWAIAAETLADAGFGHDEEDVLAYWSRLVAANRARLVDPANPDLLFPGQVLVLPPLSGG
jgi:hypothetical protein